MSRRLLGLALLSILVSLRGGGRARAETMDLALSRLSEGDCAATLAGGPLVLRAEGQQTLRADEPAFRRIVSQLSASIASTQLSPVTTAGPAGLELAFETSITALDHGASDWQRATRGRASRTCDGRNEDVRALLVANQLHFEKGLPFGLSLGASVGKLHATSMYLAGVDLKLALLEEVARSQIPDLALRAALTRLLGADQLTMHVASFDAIVSERVVIRHRVALSPYLGGGLTWTRATTGTIDLTPNIDAVACRAGVDPVCNAGQLGASADDLGHDVRFGSVSLLRYRAFAGLWIRYQRVALSSSVAGDVVPPRVGDRARGETAGRQWTVSVAPSVSF